MSFLDVGLKSNNNSSSRSSSGSSSGSTLPYPTLPYTLPTLSYPTLTLYPTLPILGGYHYHQHSGDPTPTLPYILPTLSIIYIKVSIIYDIYIIYEGVSKQQAQQQAQARQKIAITASKSSGMALPNTLCTLSYTLPYPTLYPTHSILPYPTLPYTLTPTLP